MKTTRRRCKRPKFTNLMPVITSCSMSYASSMNLAQTDLNPSLDSSSLTSNIVQTKFKAGTEIIPSKLYLTSLEEAENANFLLNKSITAVLTINNEPCKIPVEIEKLGGIRKLFINLGDNCTSQISDYFEEIIDFINENKCVLVHCYAGVSRSATAVIAYMMKTHNMQLDQAMKFVGSKRHIICPNFSFMGQLKSYEIKLNALEKPKFSPTLIFNSVGMMMDGEKLIVEKVNCEELDCEKLKKELEKFDISDTCSSQARKSDNRTSSFVFPKLALCGDHDSGVDTSESSNESPLGSPKNKVQKIEFEHMQHQNMQSKTMTKFGM